jgi:hypothetical protein
VSRAHDLGCASGLTAAWARLSGQRVLTHDRARDDGPEHLNVRVRERDGGSERRGGRDRVRVVRLKDMHRDVKTRLCKVVHAHSG